MHSSGASIKHIIKHRIIISFSKKRSNSAVVNAPHKTYPILHVVRKSIARTTQDVIEVNSIIKNGGLRILYRYDVYIMIVRSPMINVTTNR